MRKLLLLCSMLLAGFAAGAQCAASFSSAPAPLNNALLRVQFTNTSSWGLPFSGQTRTAVINYGDGNTASIGTTSPAHTYASPGVYTVGIRIYSIDSVTSTLICTDTFGTTITVSYSSCATSIGLTGSGYNRTFFATTPAGASGMVYTWNFGDGSPTTTGTPASHTYATNGTYTVTLTAVKASTSCTYVNTLNVSIYVPPAPLNCSPLKAGFNTSVTANMVSTTNTSAAISSPYKVDFIWRYGDGSTSTSANPLPHAYSATGIYLVTLVATYHDSLFTTQCKDSITKTVAITTIPAPSNLISGTVFYDSVTYGINNFKVWLIRFDSTTNLLYAVDSQITANTAFPFYSFSGKAAGSYRTKAAVYIGSTGGTGIVPTYHDSSSYWNTAKVINHTGGTSLNKHIYMSAGTLPSGPGFIGGNVSLGANKGSGNGAEGMLILIRNASMKIVQATLTDANGDYSFANIPIGSYSIYPEEINYATTPVTPVVITSSNPEDHNVSFNKDVVKRSIAPRAAVGIAGGNYSVEAALAVFPNPASNMVTISWKGAAESANQFTITSITGNVVARSPFVHGRDGSIDMNISGLAGGVYFVHGTGAMAGSISKLIIR